MIVVDQRVFEEVAEIVSRKLKIAVEAVNPQTVIEDYCTDSIMFIDLLGALQHKFAPGKETIFNGAIQVVTVGDLARVIERAQH